MNKYFSITTILIGVFIVSCGKDNLDDNPIANDEPKLLTELIDGAVWRNDVSAPNYTEYIALYNTPQSLDFMEIYNENKYTCYPNYFGEVNNEGDTVFVLEENENNLLLSFRGNDGYIAHWKISLIDNGSSLKTQWIVAGEPTEESDFDYWTKSSQANPCR